MPPSETESALPRRLHRLTDRRSVQRFALAWLLFSMLFILSPVAPFASFPFSYPIYWALLALLVVLTFVERPDGRSLGAFVIALLALGLWMAAASIHHEPRLLRDLLIWESGILLAIYAAIHYPETFDFRFLSRFFAAVVALQLMVCLVQFMVYENGQPTVAPEFFRQLFGDQAIYRPGRDPVRAGWRFVTGAPGLGRRLTVAPGTLWTVNVLGAWIALALPVLLGAAQSARQASRDRQSLAYFALAGGGILLIVRNLTRGAFVGAVFGLIVYFALSRQVVGRERRPAFDRRKVAAVLVAILLLGALTVGRQGLRLFQGALQGRSVSVLVEDAMLRARLAAAGSEAVATHPFLGTGHGNYRNVMPQTDAVVEGLSKRQERILGSHRGKTLSAHNAFLMLAHDAGLPALALMVVALIAAWKAFWTRRGEWTYGQVSLAASTAAGMCLALYYGSMYREMWPISLFLLGCLYAGSRYASDGS